MHPLAFWQHFLVLSRAQVALRDARGAAYRGVSVTPGGQARKTVGWTFSQLSVQGWCQGFHFS